MRTGDAPVQPEGDALLGIRETVPIASGIDRPRGGGWRARLLSIAPWTALVLAVALGAIGLALGVELRTVAESEVGTAAAFLPLFGIVPFALTGALVAAKRPDNAVGWLLLLTGCVFATSLAAGMAASYDLAHEGSVPGSAGLAWLAANLWYAGLLSIPYLLTRFPDGRPLSSRWRVVDLLAALLLVDIVVVSLEPGRLPDYPRIENPLGVGPLAEPARVFEAVGLGLFVCYLVLAASSVVVRFRRSDGVERLQLKWLAFTVSSTAVVWLASMLVDSGWVADVVWTLGYLGLSCIPVSIGVAVLRYRLYEIDRLISRTLVYAAVTVVLAATYVALVLGGEAAFASFTGGSHLAIAVSTLVVAALFLPVRARMQRLVDRRFYRRRYDAQRTLETFGSRLREQLDLETLAAETVAVVTETMEPETTSLWLRKQAVR